MNIINILNTYIRNKKSILVVLADIGALFSALYSVFSFIFYFYSRNFDNYKIVNEVLTINEKNKKLMKKLIRTNSIKSEEIPFQKRNYEIEIDADIFYLLILLNLHQIIPKE